LAKETIENTVTRQSATTTVTTEFNTRFITFQPPCWI
jgi:hypothetical protein